MRKYSILLFIVFSCNINQENFELSGNINGLENGVVYLIESNSGEKEIILDSTRLNNSSSFLLKGYIKEPQILKIRIEEVGRRNIRFVGSNTNEIEFFAEIGKMELNTSYKRLQFDAQFSGSRHQENLDKFNSYLTRFEEEDLDLLVWQLSPRTKDNEIDSISILRENNDKRKILFIINYITNNSKEVISPYLALKYSQDIQPEYLAKIYKSYNKEIAESKYGIELSKIINK